MSQLHLFRDVDVIQVGARNMQNFELLKELAMSTNPSCSNAALQHAAGAADERGMAILAGGNEQVIL